MNALNSLNTMKQIKSKIIRALNLFITFENCGIVFYQPDIYLIFLAIFVTLGNVITASYIMS